MDYTFLLLSSYGLCFAVQNKVNFLHNKTAFTDALLACTFCTGFHAGWIVWLASTLLNGAAFSLESPGHMALFALSSAAFCYALDTCVQWAERAAPGGAGDE